MASAAGDVSRPGGPLPLISDAPPGAVACPDSDPETSGPGHPDVTGPDGDLSAPDPGPGHPIPDADGWVGTKELRAWHERRELVAVPSILAPHTATECPSGDCARHARTLPAWVIRDHLDGFTTTGLFVEFLAMQAAS